MNRARRVCARLVVLALFCPVLAWLDIPPAAAQEFNKILPSVVSILPVWPRGSSKQLEPEGSGVVVLNGRLVLTALHVIEPAKKILIRSSDGRVLDARLKGLDRPTDLALLEIDEKLPALSFGDDATLGSRACAVGNTFGLGLSVTCGIVSGVHKAGLKFNAVEDFVQTDAAVNPGASGGALVDKDGQLIGVLSAIFTKKSDSNIGVNFAVAAPLAKLVAQDLAKEGEVWRRPTGVRMVQYPPRGQTGELAAYVLGVRPDSPAQRAGLKAGDKIIFAGTRRISKPADFVSAIARLRPGDSLSLSLRGAQGGLVKKVSLSFK